ncbi:hypothetical protein HmCmsJML293_03560 [Escherichia coli]|nr:hypothetical protein HmCmsJML293_03560 [Escherichia coli]
MAVKTIHDFQGIFIRMRDHNGLGKTIYFNGFFQQFFFGWCHVVWVVIIRHKLIIFDPQNTIYRFFPKRTYLMDRHADFINRFDAIVFRQAGEKLR